MNIMSKNYRRLTLKDQKKLKFYGKIKVYLKKALKSTSVILLILVLFMTGILVFYNILDTNSRQKYSNVADESVNSKLSACSDDTALLNESQKKELEREFEKQANLSKSESQEENKQQCDPQDFSRWNSYCNPELIIINDANLIPSDFEVKTKICRGKEVGDVIADDLEKMISDAKKEGIVLWISSGYRNVALQTTLFNREVEREKSKCKEVISQQEAENRAARVVARPSASEHNTGLAVDFNGVCYDFYTTKEYKWLMDNAQKYGFIERYRKEWKNYTCITYEPWHFRYVGKEMAPLIKESGLCLEEYVRNKLIDRALEGNL